MCLSQTPSTFSTPEKLTKESVSQHGRLRSSRPLCAWATTSLPILHCASRSHDVCEPGRTQPTYISFLDLGWPPRLTEPRVCRTEQVRGFRTGPTRPGLYVSMLDTPQPCRTRCAQLCTHRALGWSLAQALRPRGARRAYPRTIERCTVSHRPSRCWLLYFASPRPSACNLYRTR